MTSEPPRRRGSRLSALKARGLIAGCLVMPASATTSLTEVSAQPSVTFTKDIAPIISRTALRVITRAKSLRSI
jgi:hypothetical protein